MPELYAGQHLAVFRGLTPHTRELDVEVVIHDGSLQLPAMGEFLLIEMAEGMAALARVTHAFPCGPIASYQGETYLAELGRSGQEMPRQVREHVLRFTLKLLLLGRMSVQRGAFELQVGMRKFPAVGAKVYAPSPAALHYICNAGLTGHQLENEVPVPFGHYVLGDQPDSTIEIKFDINRLKRKRSFVFARAGYGKSNLIKYLISQLYASKPETGLLIIDPEGEYATRSATVPGLADVPGLRDKLHVYSQRKPAEIGPYLRGQMKVDFGTLAGETLVTSFSPVEKHSHIWASWIRSANSKQLQELISLLHAKGYKASDEEISQILNISPSGSKEGGRNVSIQAILNNLLPSMKRLHATGGINVKQLREALRQGHVVILDTSLLSSSDARSLTEIVLVSLFHYNVRTFTAGSETGSEQPISCIAVFEEAQTILGHQGFSETSIYVRWVKEGRKYGLGSIMITQQPGAISDQILSQGDNFFVMHLLNQLDLDALHRINAHFSQDILQQLRHEPIKGNCYFWSAPDQPYVVCARVHNFDQIITRLPDAALPEPQPMPPPIQVPPDEPAPQPVPAIPAAAEQSAGVSVQSASVTAPAPEPFTMSGDQNGAAPSLRTLILQEVSANRDVWVFPHRDTGAYVVSLFYLARSLGMEKHALKSQINAVGLGLLFGRLPGGKFDEDIVLIPKTMCTLTGKELRPDAWPVIDAVP